MPVMSNDFRLAFDGHYYRGAPRRAPDGTYVSGEGAITRAPDGTYVAGSFVSGDVRLAPDGTLG
jgi:hypothetical protein